MRRGAGANHSRKAGHKDAPSLALSDSQKNSTKGRDLLRDGCGRSVEGKWLWSEIGLLTVSTKFLTFYHPSRIPCSAHAGCLGMPCVARQARPFGEWEPVNRR